MSQDSYNLGLFSQDDDLSSAPPSDNEDNEENEIQRAVKSLGQVPQQETFRDRARKHPAAEATRTCPGYESGLDSHKANRVPFGSICNLVASFSAVPTSKRRKSLEDFFVKNHLNEPNLALYPFIRLLLPDHDSGRPRYFIRESTLARMYKQALLLPDALAKRLERFNDPALNEFIHANELTGETFTIRNGRLPTVLRQVLLVYCGINFAGDVSRPLTCGEVNDYLDRLHDAAGVTEKSKVLRELIFVRKVWDARQHSVLCKIILKGTLGIDSNNLLAVVHQDAVQGLSVLGDLRRVLAACALSPSVGFSYELFAPGRPMLASRTRIDMASAKLGDFIIEEKMDGDRMIVHLSRTRGEYRLFTRNQKDFTNVYGTPLLVQALFQGFDCAECIVDGEMVPYDAIKGDVIRCGRCINLEIAQELFKRSSENTGDRFLCFYAFDIMYIRENEGDAPRDLTPLPLWERKSILSRIFRPSTSSLQRVRLVRPMQVVKDCPDLDARHNRIMEQLDWIIRERREGLVLKAIDAPYSLCGRSPLWVKVKPDYVGHLSEGLDCIVLGGEYFGDSIDRVFHGSKDVSRLLFGLKYPTRTKEGFAYRPFCLTGVGLTGLDFKFIHRKFQDKAILSSEKLPKHFRWTGCPVWLPPEDSFIVEVTGTQMFKQFRFPYVRGIRYDKSWDESATVDECDDRFQQGYLFANLRARDIKRTDFHGKNTQRSGLISGGGPRRHLEEALVSNIFDGMMFLVFAGEYPYENLCSKEDVERLIRVNGGRIRDIKDGFQANVYIAADQRHVRLRNMINSKRTCPRVLSLPYLLECLRQERIVEPLVFHHIIYLGHEAKGGIATIPQRPDAKRSRVAESGALPMLDEFGDSYWISATMESLTTALHRATPSMSLDPEPFDEEEEEAMMLAATRFFHKMRVFTDVTDGIDELIVLLRLYGGEIVADPQLATHVLVRDESQLQPKLTSSVCINLVQLQTTLQRCQVQNCLWYRLGQCN